MRSTLLFLLFIPVSLFSQNAEKVSLRINYNHQIEIESFEKMCINTFDLNYPFQQPTFLGNVQSFDIDVALRIKPNQLPVDIELILRNTSMKFTGGDYYNNLKCKIYSPGVGFLYKYPLAKNIYVSGYVSFLMGIASLTRDNNEKFIYYDEFGYMIKHDQMEKKFIVPAIEPGLEIEYMITSMLGLQARVGMELSSFPDFDIESPMFYKTLLLSAGFRYNILRNKSLIY
ncbi:MAG: hypothetical protein FD170_570 [Bacteroidetes bacterium]|nr:MAG: hypothetical protein FD170_570 [Bacteroidota bacterium]